MWTCGKPERAGYSEEAGDTQTFIVEHLGELMFTGLAALMGYLGKELFKTVQEQKALKDGVKAMLHDRIYQSCNFYLKQGFIDLDGLTNIGQLYETYHALGGNGTGTALYNKVQALPVQDGA